MTTTHHEKPPAGHIRTSKGHIHERELKQTVAHHERIVTAINMMTGVKERGLVITRHVDYHHKGELVRRDIHVNAPEETPLVPHDVAPSPLGNAPMQSRAFTWQKPEGSSRVYMQTWMTAGVAVAPWFNPFDELLERIRRGLAILAGLTTALCTSLKVELAKATHDFTNGGDTFKMALFKANAAIVGTYGAATTNYSDMTGNGDELANGNGYTTGGAAWTMNTPLSSGVTAYWGPSADLTWTSSTFTTRGGLSYNSSKANKGWFVYDFGADEPVVAGTFTVSPPANAVGTAMTRIA